MTDTDLYERGVRTAAACWEALAHSTSSADVHRLPHVSVAVFADQPEQSIYNNAILGHGLARPSAPPHWRRWRLCTPRQTSALSPPGSTKRIVGCVTSSRAAATPSTPRHARWGCRSTTSHCRGPRSSSHQPHGASTCASSASRRLLRDLDPAALHLLVAQRGGESVATAFGFDHEGDCGIYNVGTLAHSRRRGFGTALTATLLHDALARGCRTASLQSTPAAERMYGALGFRDLGRIIEYTPTRRGARSQSPLSGSPFSTKKGCESGGCVRA